MRYTYGWVFNLNIAERVECLVTAVCRWLTSPENLIEMATSYMCFIQHCYGA